jgi:hypothetical protein
MQIQVMVEDSVEAWVEALDVDTGDVVEVFGGETTPLNLTMLHRCLEKKKKFILKILSKDLKKKSMPYEKESKNSLKRKKRIPKIWF